MEFVFDEEAVYQDADVLQAQYEEESRQFVAMQRAGFCMHSSWVQFAINPETGEPYYPEQIGLVGEQVRCTERCGRVFDTEDELRHTAPIKCEGVQA